MEKPSHTKLRLLLLQKFRHIPKTAAVYIVGGIFAVLMKHHNIGNGKAVSLKIFRVVDIEFFPNAVKGNVCRKGRGIDKLIIRPVYGVSRRLQAVVRLKVQVPCGVAAG